MAVEHAADVGLGVGLEESSESAVGAGRRPGRFDMEDLGGALMLVEIVDDGARKLGLQVIADDLELGASGPPTPIGGAATAGQRLGHEPFEQTRRDLDRPRLDRRGGAARADLGPVGRSRLGHLRNRGRHQPRSRRAPGALGGRIGVTGGDSGSRGRGGTG
jgi:hypothetical protein